VGYLNWSSDAARLYFLSINAKTQPQLMAVEMANRRPYPVASLAGIRQPPFSFGDWIGLGPEDTLLALRDLGTEEILCWRIEGR
jgi:hypothetical protein